MEGLQRYRSQLGSGGFSEEEQQRLSASSVLVVGAGGLGCPVLTALSGVGVGSLGIVDSDVVSLSNLNRQFLYTESQLGQPKAQLAGQRIREVNSTVETKTYPYRLTEENAEELIADYDLVLLCVDNMETRQTVNRACHAQNKRLVNAGINGFYGEVMLVEYGVTPCLACAYGKEEQEWASIAPIAMAVGAFEAIMAVEVLLGKSEQFYGKKFLFDGYGLRTDTVILKRSAACPVCGTNTKK